MKKITMKYICQKCGKHVSLDIIPGTIKDQTIKLYYTLYSNDVCLLCNSESLVSSSRELILTH